MIKESHVIVKWNPRTKNHYKSRGYVFTKIGDDILAKITDLPDGSDAIVTRICDECNNEQKVKYSKLYHKCKQCALKLLWQNKEHQEKIRDTMTKLHSDKSHKQKLSASMKKLWENESFRTRNTERARIQFSKEGTVKRDRREDKQNTDWRKAVYKRDNYTCQKCLISGGRLNAHHILNYLSSEDHRYNHYNGITFCEACHKLFHSTYGLRNNTVEQLEEFLSESK